MTVEPLLTRVLDLVARVAGPHRTPPGPGPETPLAEGGFWLDSGALLEVVVACEATFGVSFDPDTELTPQSLSTVASLAAVIRAKSCSGGPPRGSG